MYGDGRQPDSTDATHASQPAYRTWQRSESDIVVVYDDPDIGFIIARALEKIGYQVHCIPYKGGTLNRVTARRFRLAVLEIKKADDDGLRRLEAIRKAAPGLPVILVSGIDYAIGRIARLGVKDWIDKPFRLEQVRAAVKRVLT